MSTASSLIASLFCREESRSTVKPDVNLLDELQFEQEFRYLESCKRVTHQQSQTKSAIKSHLKSHNFKLRHLFQFSDFILRVVESFANDYLSSPEYFLANLKLIAPLWLFSSSILFDTQHSHFAALFVQSVLRWEFSLSIFEFWILFLWVLWPVVQPKMYRNFSNIWLTHKCVQCLAL